MNENQKRMRNKNPLLTVVSKDYLEAAKFLIEQGADVTCFANAAIIEAVKNDNFEMVKLLIDSGADATARNNEPIKITIRGAKYGDPEIMDYLILSGADSSLVDDSMYDILNDAIEYGNLKMAEYIISNGADVTYNDNEAICIAADSVFNSDGEEILKLLINAGADVNARNGYPLIAVSYARYCISLLIENGADVHACEHCALLIASEHHNGDLFYSACVSSDVRADFTKCIEYAAKHRYTDIVYLLLRRKQANDYLVYATERWYSETVKLLLDSGYEGDKIKALKIACKRNMPDIIRAIIDSGCDFRDQRSFNLINIAVINCSMDVVISLIVAGVQLTEEAFYYAAYENKSVILEVLLSNKKSYAEAALRGALASGNIKIVKLLTDKYVDITSCYVNDLLVSAIEGKNSELVKYVLSHCNINHDHIEHIARTAVIDSIALGQDKLLKYLVGLGMKTNENMLEVAVNFDQLKCAKILLETGVKPNEETLQLAFEKGNVEILKAFLDAGVSII